MKCRLLLFLASILVPYMALGQTVDFNEFFVDSTLRMDYYHIGNKTEELFTLDRLVREGPWAGNPHSLLETLPSGRYRLSVRDAATGRVIFSKGYDTYFGEYRTTDPAAKGVKRTYQESLLMPMPKHPVKAVIEIRDKSNNFHPLFTQEIDPADYHIIRESPNRGDTVIEVVHNGDPHTKVDILIVGEGYSAQERGKFETDLRRYADTLFSWEPYKSHRSDFNVRGIFVVSPESGVDEPRQGRMRHTALHATFNSLDSDRYLLTEETRTLHEIAAQAPYDALLIMVNSKRYGGGGIFNNMTLFTSDGGWNSYVFQHEFGHAFAGLADEYYTTDVAYDGFYAPGVEPPEPNITALLDAENLKWKHLVTPGLSIPTAWGQKTYDSLNTSRDSLAGRHARRVAELRAKAVPDTVVRAEEAAYQKEIGALNTKIRQFIENHPLKGKIGAFEGAGYVPKGFYRPTVNSLMREFSTSERTFYGVNEEAIVRAIRHYSE